MGLELEPLAAFTPPRNMVSEMEERSGNDAGSESQRQGSGLGISRLSRPAQDTRSTISDERVIGWSGWRRDDTSTENVEGEGSLRGVGSGVLGVSERGDKKGREEQVTEVVGGKKGRKRVWRIVRGLASSLCPVGVGYGLVV